MKGGWQNTMNVHIRWMIRRDYPEVLEVEEDSFDFPWLERDLTRYLNQRNCIGMLAEYDDRVVGFMLYKLHKTRFHLVNFAVAADCRRQGVGSQMVACLIGKLKAEGKRRGRQRIVLEVRETNLPAQLFFRSKGFRAVSVLRGYFSNDEDAYLMEYRKRRERSGALEAGNRISKLVG